MPGKHGTITPPTLTGAGSFLGSYFAAVNGPLGLMRGFPTVALASGCFRRVSIASSNAAASNAPTDSLGSVYAKVSASAIAGKLAAQSVGGLNAVPSALLGATAIQYTAPVVAATALGSIVTVTWPSLIPMGLILVEDFAPLGQ